MNPLCRPVASYHIIIGTADTPYWLLWHEFLYMHHACMLKPEPCAAHSVHFLMCSSVHPWCICINYGLVAYLEYPQNSLILVCNWGRVFVHIIQGISCRKSFHTCHVVGGLWPHSGRWGMSEHGYLHTDRHIIHFLLLNTLAYWAS